jgi:hypothetical protein
VRANARSAGSSTLRGPRMSMPASSPEPRTHRGGHPVGPGRAGGRVGVLRRVQPDSGWLGPARRPGQRVRLTRRQGSRRT